MESADILHYDPEVDIAMICLERGRAVGKEYPWGLIERDHDTGRVMGFEIWQASTVLPAEMIEALSSQMDLTPDITHVAVPRHGTLRLTFADGLAGEVDVLDRMRGPVFDEARTPRGFAEARVDPELGTVCWPGGADLAPDTLYERVRTGLWPGQSRAAQHPS
jgi:uncharacterized protein YuzE